MHPGARSVDIREFGCTLRTEFLSGISDCHTGFFSGHFISCGSGAVNHDVQVFDGVDPFGRLVNFTDNGDDYIGEN